MSSLAETVAFIVDIDQCLIDSVNAEQTTTFEPDDETVELKGSLDAPMYVTKRCGTDALLDYLFKLASGRVGLWTAASKGWARQVSQKVLLDKHGGVRPWKFVYDKNHLILSTKSVTDIARVHGQTDFQRNSTFLIDDTYAMHLASVDNGIMPPKFMVENRPDPTLDRIRGWLQSVDWREHESVYTLTDNPYPVQSNRFLPLL